MTRLNHDSWLYDGLQLGWRYGEHENKELIISSAIRKYDELSNDDKERIKFHISKMPEYFRAVGLE